MTTPDDRASSDRIRVLHVDDQPEFAELAAAFLERADDRIEVVTADSAVDGLDRLAEGDVDCIVSDYDMPDTNGLEFLEAVREADPDLPFILFTGKGSEEVASEAISAGVTDYLQKARGTDQYALLANRVGNAVEQYRSKRAVEATERKLTQLAEKTDDVLFMFDGDWEELLFVNSAYEAVWDASTAELEADPRSFLEYVHPEDRQRVETALERLVGGESVEVEYRVVHDDGVKRWVQGQAKPIFDDDGSVARIAGFVRDVTDHRRREDRLQRATARLEALFDDSPDMMDVHDADGTIVDVNRRICEELGYTEEELVGRKVWEIDRTADPDELRATWDGMATDETLKVDGRFERRDGSTFPVEVHLVRLDLDGEDRFLVISRDVTDRTERERELQRYRKMVNAMRDSACVYDAEGRFDIVNDYLADFYNTTPDALEGRPSHLVQRIREQADGDPYRELVDGERDEIRGEVEATFPGHGHGVVDYRLTRLTVDGEFDGVVAVSRDITDRTEREGELAFRTALLEAQAETAIDGLLVVDTDRDVVFHNDRFLDIWDVPESVASTQFDEALLDHVSDQLEDPDAFREQVEYLYAHPDETRRDTIPLNDGRWLDRYSAPVVDDGTHYGRLWVFRDVTDRETGKQRIEALHDVTRDLIGAESPEAIAAIAVDAARDVLDLPVTGCWLYDEAADALEPVAVTDEAGVLVGDHPTYERGQGLSWTAFERGEIAVYDDLSTVEGTMNPDTNIRSELIVPLGAYGVLNVGATEPDAFDETDVSLARILGRNVEAALVRAERERELSRQNERLEEFASIVSHDLRNPLNVLDGTLELVEETGEIGDLDSCQRAIDRMDALIDDLLALAREGKAVGDTEAVDLRTLVEACWRTVDTRDATLNVVTDRVVRCDRSRMRQLLENLVRNSVEHGGPAVTITVGDLDEGRGFYVADDGPGVPADERERVFESGYSTTPEGTGFGLAIVERIAESHGWDVRLTESDAGGARFEFTGVDLVE